MGEVIKFPSDEIVGDGIFCVVEDEGEEICWVNTSVSARNIARILAFEWPGNRYTVKDASNKEIFEVEEEYNPE